MFLIDDSSIPKLVITEFLHISQFAALPLRPRRIRSFLLGSSSSQNFLCSKRHSSCYFQLQFKTRSRSLDLVMSVFLILCQLYQQHSVVISRVVARYYRMAFPSFVFCKTQPFFAGKCSILKHVRHKRNRFAL